MNGKFNQTVERYCEAMLDAITAEEARNIDVDDYVEDAWQNFSYDDFGSCAEEVKARFKSVFTEELYAQIFSKHNDGTFFWFRNLPAERGEEVQYVWCLEFTNEDGISYETDNLEAETRERALADALEYLRSYHG